METITSEAFAKSFWMTFLDIMEHPEAHRGIRTGIPTLDEKLRGWKPGWFIVVGGAQKSGKSTFMTSVLAHMAMASPNKRILYVGLEMDNYETAERIMAARSRVPIGQISDGDVGPDEITRLGSAVEVVSKWNVYWNVGASDMPELEGVIESIDPDVIFLDYFQLMNWQKYARYGRQQETSAISRRLKQITMGAIGGKKRLIVAGSQMNREGAKSDAVSANFFRDTGSLEQDCNLAMLIRDYKNPAGVVDDTLKRVNIVASRHSAKFELLMQIVGEYATMGESTQEEVDIGEKFEKAMSRPVKRKSSEEDEIDRMFKNY